MRDTRDVRATGLQGDASPEIIEIIDDDTNPFHDRAGNDRAGNNGADNSDRRWIGPFAVTALVVLIGYGVATSASTSGVPRAAPATSSSPATSTTVPATSTTVPAPTVPYYAAEPPPEFTLGFAEIQSQIGMSYYAPGTYSLFATEGATAASGRWFSINVYPGDTQSVYATDAYRLVNDQIAIAISHTPSGQSIAQYTPGGRNAVTLTAFGWSDDDLVRLAESIRVDQDGAFQFSEPTLIADHQLLSAVQPWLAIQNNPSEQIFYAASGNPNGGFGITVAPRLPPSQGGSPLDRQLALRFFFDHNTPFEVDGHSAVAGGVIGQPEYAMATWIAGDHIITVSGLMPVQQLITIAETVHPVSAAVWDEMTRQVTGNGGSNAFGDYHETQQAPVSFGTDAEGKLWTISVAVATFSNQQQINWQWDNNGFGSSAVETATIKTVVDSHRTYVLADLPRSIAAKADLHVTRAGLDPVVVAFNDVDPNLDRTFAAYAFSEPGLYNAQIVGADGTVLAAYEFAP